MGNKKFNPAPFLCPSDDTQERARTAAFNGYRYSYSVNSFMSLLNVTKVHNASQKVLLLEEDTTTIDDGHATLANNSSINLLSVRHDRRRRPETATTGLQINGDCSGNAAFVDGHSEYIDRKTIHDPLRYDPTK